MLVTSAESRAIAHARGVKAHLIPVVLASVALVLVACDGDEGAPAPTAGASAAPTLRVPTLPTIGVSTPAATIVPQPPEFDGLAVGDPVDFPSGIELFTWDGCTSCDGPPSALVRVRRTTEGFDRAVVWESESPRFILDAWVDGDGLYLIQCESGTCGFGTIEPPVSGQVVLYGSSDGGDSWSKVIELGLATETGEFIYPSGTPRPHGVILSDDGIYNSPDGPLELALLDEAERFIIRNALSLGAMTIVEWIAVISEERGSAHHYLSVFDGAHHNESHLSNGFSPTAPLRDGRIIGLGWYGRPPWSFDIRGVQFATEAGGAPPYEAWLPSVLDVESGTVHPIIEHFAERPVNRNSVVGIRYLD